MDFDWLDAPFDLKKLAPKEIEESFEDPFSLRLLPDGVEDDEKARYFNLGKSINDRGIFTVFWADTRLEVRLMNASLLKADTRESTTITLRFDPRLLARIKRIARSRYLNYQSMIKQWLSERLEKEM